MRVFDKVVTGLNEILLVLGAIVVMALMSIAIINIAFPLAGGTIPGAYEIVAYLGAIAIALALGIAEQEKSHIIVDIVTEKFSKKANRILDTVNYVITRMLYPLSTFLKTSISPPTVRMRPCCVSTLSDLRW